LFRGSNIGWVLLRRPIRFLVVHLLIIFRSKRGGGDKRVSDEFISIHESITSLAEIDDPFYWLIKEIGIAEIPISRNEEDLFNGSGL
jgi:hypothetical protein